jgi:hypothetical protein
VIVGLAALTIVAGARYKKAKNRIESINFFDILFV